MDLLSYKKESKNGADISGFKTGYKSKYDVFQFTVNEAVELKKMQIKEVNLQLSIAIYQPSMYNYMLIKIAPEVAKKGIILLEGFKLLTCNSLEPISIDLISLVNDEVINPGTAIIQGLVLKSNDIYDDVEERDELNTVSKDDKYLHYRRGRNKEEQDNPPVDVVVTDEMLKEMEEIIRKANEES